MADEADTTMEGAVRGLLQPEPKGQPDAEEVTDVTEADPEDAEETEEDIEEVEADHSEDDDEVETEDEDEAEEAEEEDDEDPLIDVNGEEIAFSELQKGYLRNKDYTQKTQALAEERRTWEGQVQQVKGHLQQQYAQLKDALATFAIEQEQEPDWDNLEGAEYVKAQKDWDKKQKRKKDAADMYRAIQEQQQTEVIQQETQALMQAFPDWQDQAVMAEQITTLTNAAQDYGFAPEEVAGITDHRMIKVLHRLSQLETKATADKANNAKIAKRVAKAAKKPAPGAKPAKNHDSDKVHRQKKDRLKKTGSVDAAMAWIMDG